jgi:hypothetical protein
MDPRDRLSDLVDGGHCAACGRPVPRDQVRLLASRDDLLFAELPCRRCGSVSLAIFVGPGVISRRAPISGPAEGPRPVSPDASGAPIGPDDVLDMHRFLADWTGDLHTLVGRPGEPGAGPGAV